MCRGCIITSEDRADVAAMLADKRFRDAAETARLATVEVQRKIIADAAGQEPEELLGELREDADHLASKPLANAVLSVPWMRRELLGAWRRRGEHG